MSDRYVTSTRKDEYKSVDVICKYEDARKIICELVTTGYDIAFINELANPEWDNYTDAFVIGVFRNEIWCEPVKRDSGYVSVEADVVYIFSDCNSKIIPNIESDEVYEVRLGCDDCDGDCENCDCHDIDTTSTANTTASYKVNGKSVDKETYEKAIEDIEEKYLDGIRDMLLRYCEIQDEMNKWRKMLW